MSDSIKKWHDMLEDGYQPIPKDPIVESVINTMRARSRDGIREYGTTLYDNPDGFYKWLNEIQHELLDAAIYIEKIKKIK